MILTMLLFLLLMAVFVKFCRRSSPPPPSSSSSSSDASRDLCLGAGAGKKPFKGPHPQEETIRWTPHHHGTNASLVAHGNGHSNLGNALNVSLTTSAASSSTKSSGLSLLQALGSGSSSRNAIAAAGFPASSAASPRSDHPKRHTGHHHHIPPGHPAQVSGGARDREGWGGQKESHSHKRIETNKINLRHSEGDVSYYTFFTL